MSVRPRSWIDGSFSSLPTVLNLSNVQVRVQLPTSAVSVALPAFAAAAPCCYGASAAGRRTPSDRYLPPAGRAAANLPHAAAAVDRWDRRTEGRTQLFFYPTPAVVSPAVVLVPHNIVLMCLQLGSRTCNPRQFRYLVIVERHDVESGAVSSEGTGVQSLSGHAPLYFMALKWPIMC